MMQSVISKAVFRLQKLFIKALIGLSLLFSLLLVSGNAQAQNSCTIPAPALRNFALSQTLQTCDDCTSGAVNMGFAINYFGTNHNNIFVNSNGNATFGGGFTGFTPSGLGSVSEAILAPYFGDVDLRSAGTVRYGSTTLGGRPAFVINWDNVGYFSNGTNRINTFQMVLVSRADIASGDFDVEFNYNQIQWEAGDSSGGNDGLGGTSAVVGYSDGIVVSFLELTGSLVNGAFLDNNPNTGLINDGTGAQCGRYLFEIRNGTPQVVLGFDKSFNPSTVNLGTTSRLRFNIDNTVNILDVANINFTDNLPAGMQVASPPNANTTCTGGTITAVPGSSTVSYSGGSVTGSSTCRVGVNVITASAGNFVNISGDLTSDVGNSGTATATLTVNSVVDIALSQTESVDPVVAGSGPNNLVYVLTAANNGSNNATGVRIGNNLTLPTGVSVSSVTPSRGSFAAGEWTLGNLDAGDSEALTVVLTVGAGAASGTNVISSQGTLNNVNEIDSNNANNTVNTSTSIAANVDLALSQTESIDPVLAGSGAGNLSYVLRVDNNGPVTATGIVINDVLSLPAGTSLLSSTPSLGSFNGSNWSIASLAPGGNATLTLVLTVGATTAPGNNVISNQATLTSVAQPDSNPANNSVTTATSVSAAVDIALSQTESIDPVVAGSGNGNLTYILRARNNGPSLATGVVVAEALTLPSGVSLNSATPSQGTFNANNWALGSLAPGAEETLTLVITATANAQPGTNVIASQANVSALNQTDTNAANDTVTTATSISRAVDLALSQSESIDPVLAGSGPGNLTYVLTVSNNGPSDATGVSISDNLTLPSGVSLDSATPSQGSFNAGVWSLGNLPASASETLTLVLTAAANTVAGTDVISSAASVSALNESDSNGANDSVTTATSVTSSIDLALSQTESIDPVIAGSGSGNLTYVLTVANNGPSNASGVSINENLTLRAGTSIDSITPSQGSFNAGIWSLGNLPSGTSQTLTIVLTVGPDTIAGNNVLSSAASVNSVNESDSNAANDAVTTSTSVTSSIDLALSQTESIDPVIAGSGVGNLSYVLTVANNGPSRATGVSLNENLTLPAGVSLNSVTPSQGSFNAGIWSLGNLPSGASETLTLVLTAAANTVSGTDVISSSASINAVNEPDSNGANDAVTTATSVESSIDLALSQTESIDPVIAGSGAGNLTYVLTVANNGPSNATGVNIADNLTLPTGVTLDSTTPSQGSFNAGTWTVGNLPSGGSETLTFILTVAANTVAGTDVISSAASVASANEPDSNGANDAVTTSTSVESSIDLALSQTESIDPVIAGSGAGNLTYVLTVANNGPSNATGVNIADNLSLPTGVALDSTTPSQGSFNAGTWNVGNLPSGGSETLTFILTVAANTVAGTDVISSAANVASANEPDSNGANDAVTTSTSVESSIDLALSQTESIDPVIAGSGAGNLTYVLTVANNGPSNATGVNIADNLSLPTGVTLDSATPSQGSFNAGTWTVGNLPSGGSETLTFILTVAANTVAGTDVISSAASVASANEPDSNGANDAVTTSTSVESSIDLALSQTESIDPVVAGSGAGNLTYVLTVANNGPSDATGVNIADNLTLPTGVILDSTTPSQGSFNAGTWTLGNLPSGGSETLTFTLTVAANTVAGTDVISSAANVTAVNEPDSNAANDAVTTATSVLSQIDIALSQTSSINPVVAGSGVGNLTIEFQATNNGPSDSTATLVNVLLLPGNNPTSITAVSVTPSLGNFDENTSVWNLGRLTAGNTATLSIVLTVPADELANPEGIRSGAVVSNSNETDTDNSNDVTDEFIGIANEVDVALSQTESSDPVTAGSGAENLTYVLTAINHGPSDARNIVIDEQLTLPIGVTIDSITPSQGSYAANQWDLGTLTPASSATLTVVLTVAAEAEAGTNNIVSTAQVSAVDGTDTDPANDSVTTATSIITEVDLALSQSESVDPVEAGSGTGNLQYVLSVSNAGPSNATNVALENLLTLPAGVVLDSRTPSQGVISGDTWTLGTLTPGVTETLSITLTVPAGAEQGINIITSLARVSALTEPDSDPANDEVSTSTSVGASVDLAVTQTESADPITAGSGDENLSYVVRVDNLGVSDATAVEIASQLTLPSGVFLARNETSQGFFTNGVWTVGRIEPGSHAELTLFITVDDHARTGTDVITSTASVSAVNEADADTSNDTSSISTSIVNDSQILASVDDGRDTAFPGDSIIYTIRFENQGPSDVNDATVSDIFPAALEQVQWTCAGSGGAVCNPGPEADVLNDVVDIPVGGDVTYTVLGTVVSDFIGTLSNTASIDVPARRSASASDSTQIISPASLIAFKSVEGEFRFLQEVSYTITVENSGEHAQFDNPGAEIVDQLPIEVSLQSAALTSGGGELSVDTAANRVEWNGRIEPQGFVEIEILTLVNGGTEGALVVNQAEVFFDSDGDGANESTAVSDDLNVSGAGDPTTFIVGNAIPVPVMSRLAYLMMIFLLMAVAIHRLRERVS